MLALSTTLREAQQAASTAPRLRVTLGDRDLGVTPLRWTRWYSGSEPDGAAAVAVTSDGALVRARIDPGAGTLHVQRVATPSASSDYTQWSALGSVSSTPGVSCVAAGQRLLLASVNAAGTGVEVRESSDGGATWSAPTVVATAGPTVTAVAGAVRSDGSAAVFFAAGGVVSSVSRTGLGAWGAAAAWSQSLASVDGLAATDDEDYVVIVAGSDPGGSAGVWATLFGSGQTLPAGAWQTLTPLALASPGTGVSYLVGGVAIRVEPRVSLVERGAVDRVRIASTLAGRQTLSQLWRDPRPHEETSPFGLAITHGSGGSYLASPAGVWNAPSGAPDEDVSDDVLAFELTTNGSSQRGRVTLDDAAGRYLEGAAPVALTPGGELRLEAGFATSVGEESVELARLVITELRRERRGGRAVVEVEARGGLDALDRWRAPSQLSYAPGDRNVEQIASDLARRGGIDVLSSGAGPELTALQPAFTVRAGQRGGAALRALLERAPEVARPRGVSLHLVGVDPAATADYAYGVEHAIDSLALVDPAPAVGEVRVFGASDVGESIDVAGAAQGAATVVVVDASLDAPARVDARAATVLRRAELTAATARLTAAPNLAQELGDIVEVTDPAHGLDAARYRVAEVRYRFARSGRPRAEMQLSLTRP